MDYIASKLPNNSHKRGIMRISHNSKLSEMPDVALKVKYGGMIK